MNDAVRYLLPAILNVLYEWFPPLPVAERRLSVIKAPHASVGALPGRTLVIVTSTTSSGASRSTRMTSSPPACRTS